MTVRYTSEFIADLKRLREFIAEKNPLAAQRIANEFVDRHRQAQNISQGNGQGLSSKAGTYGYSTS